MQQIKNFKIQFY